MNFHWQNLTERLIPWHGRAWLHLGNHRSVAWEWNCRLRPRIGISAHGDEGEGRLVLSASMLFLTFYVIFSSPAIARLVSKPNDGEGVETKLELQYEHGPELWFAVWTRPMSSRSSDPWWRKLHIINFADVLLGHAKHASESIEKRDVLIPMPEGAYPATVEMTRDTWKRPRSPFTRTVRRADISMEVGIPKAGKGENSWDCGDDATWGLCMPSKTVEEAIGHTVASVLRDRRRYGQASTVRDLPSPLSPIVKIETAES